MEQSTITFNAGIFRAPTVGNEGQLSECVNLIPKNGELVNTKQTTNLNISHPNNSNKKLVAIHYIPTGGQNYIYYDDTTNKIFYNNIQTGYSLGGDLVSVKTMGNTIIATTTNNIDYLVWKTANNTTSYKKLGDIPEIEIGFFLDGHDFTFLEKDNCINFRGTQHKVDQTEDNYNALRGLAKNVIKKALDTEHKFCLPFFVRYGIELYDGTIIKQSSPELMLINTGLSPIAFSDESHSQNDVGTYNLRVALRTAELKYRAITPDWSNWKDIIKGIVIAVTPPVYRYNAAREYDSLEERNIDYQIYDNYRTDYANIFDKEFTYALNNDNPAVVTKQNWTNVTGTLSPYGVLVKYELPKFDDETYKQNILDASNFHIIQHIAYDNMAFSVDQTVNVSDILLSSISTLPVMQDDFNSHNKFSAKASFVYNNRLSIANIQETMMPSTIMLSPVDNRYNNCYIYTYIKEDNSEFITYQKTAWNSLLKWAYYPHSGAYKMDVYVTDQSQYKKYTIPLTPHPFLNGAYWMETDSVLVGETVSAIPSAIDNPKINHHNYIYTSNTNNPFFFPVSLQETIGSGTIKAISTSTKALSQGQFGQFPLYAFCSDGIWALSVAEDGKYATTNPVSRDVVENIKSICQIDNAVVFGTAQGLKYLSGSETQVISQALEGENADEDTFFDGTAITVPADTESFVKMLENASVMYDYTNQMLHVYPEDDASEEADEETIELTKVKHYVYSIPEQQWSTVIDNKVKAFVAGYPYSTLQLEDGSLHQYQPTDDKTTTRKGVILTRPMAFGQPATMKMLNDMKMFYSKTSANSKCTVAIFGSNDQRKWFKVNSLRSRSWAWYRFRIQTTLTDQDALSALIVQHDARRTNKLR